MSQHNLDETLNICLDLIQQGESIEDCLSRFPHVSDELRPIIELASQMQTIEFVPPSIPAYREGRNRLQAAVHTKQQKETKRSKLALPKFATFIPTDEIKLWIEDFVELSGISSRSVMRTALTSLILVFSLFFSVNASADSLPGDLLYPIKTLSQQARIILTSPANKAAVIDQLSAKRAEELETVLAEGNREAKVTLNGIVTRIDDNTILVDGLEISVTSETVHLTDFSNGEEVQIEVQLKNSTLSALNIEGNPLDEEPISNEDDGSSDIDEIEEAESNPSSEPEKNNGNSNNPNAEPGNNNGGSSDNPNAGPGNSNGGNSDNPNAGPGNNNGGNSDNSNSGSGNNNDNAGGKDKKDKNDKD